MPCCAGCQHRLAPSGVPVEVRIEADPRTPSATKIGSSSFHTGGKVHVMVPIEVGDGEAGVLHRPDLLPHVTAISSRRAPASPAILRRCRFPSAP